MPVNGLPVAAFHDGNMRQQCDWSIQILRFPETVITFMGRTSRRNDEPVPEGGRRRRQWLHTSIFQFMTLPTRKALPAMVSINIFRFSDTLSMSFPTDIDSRGALASNWAGRGFEMARVDPVHSGVRGLKEYPNPARIWFVEFPADPASPRAITDDARSFGDRTHLFAQGRSRALCAKVVIFSIAKKGRPALARPILIHSLATLPPFPRLVLNRARGYLTAASHHQFRSDAFQPRLVRRPDDPLLVQEHHGIDCPGRSRLMVIHVLQPRRLI